jgi:hypothetical protein
VKEDRDCNRDLEAGSSSENFLDTATFALGLDPITTDERGMDGWMKEESVAYTHKHSFLKFEMEALNT